MEIPQKTRINIRQRAPRPRPWTWELYIGSRQITGSNESFACQDEAYASAKAAIANMRSAEASKPQ